jgi:hypothetical protein
MTGPQLIKKIQKAMKNVPRGTHIYIDSISAFSRNEREGTTHLYVKSLEVELIEDAETHKDRYSITLR